MSGRSIPQQIADHGAVYCIGSRRGSVVKIGHAIDVERRLKDIQTGSAEALSIISFIPGSQRVERDLQALFADKRVRGEWFSDKGGEISETFDKLFGKFLDGALQL